MGVQFVSGLGIGAAVVVLMTMIASLTLLPALIGFAGRRTEVARWRGAIAAGLVAVSLVGLGLKISPFLVGIPLAAIVLIASLVWAPLRREVPQRAPKPRQQQLAYRWSRSVQHHPWRSVVAGVVDAHPPRHPAVRPALRLLRPGQRPDGHDHPPGLRPARRRLRRRASTARSCSSPSCPPARRPTQLQAITDAVQQTPGVVFASPARPNDPTNPTAAVWQVIPSTSPQDQATTDLVDHLRDDVLPAATQRHRRRRRRHRLGGHPGRLLQLPRRAGCRASSPPCSACRSCCCSPCSARCSCRSRRSIMNLLSIGAAYGVVVAIFQWGWLRGLVGIEAAPIEPFIPMMLFAIVFGLSMDYEVFLLSRIKEEWDRTGDSRESVADGLAATARIITVAAAIMVVVFGSFLLEPTRVIRLMGVGLAVAVLLDATVVRMLLVPATMELLGDKNWWLPTLARPDPAEDRRRGPDRAGRRPRPRGRGARRGRPVRTPRCREHGAGPAAPARSRRAARGDHRGHRPAARRARAGRDQRADRPGRGDLPGHDLPRLRRQAGPDRRRGPPRRGRRPAARRARRARRSSARCTGAWRRAPT